MSNKKVFFWLTLIGFLLYSPCLFFGFTYLDDNVLILGNLNFLTNPVNLFHAFGQDVFHTANFPAAYYRPVLTISFMIDSWLAGATPFFYHLSNILIHLLVVNLVFVFLNKLGIKRQLAFWGALIYAVHPVLTQAVAWLPGRNDSLLMLFVLLSFITAINYSKKAGSIFTHFIFFFLALFTKESALALIPLIAVYFWLLSETKPTRLMLFKFFSGWLVISIFWFLMRQHALVNAVELTINDILKAVTIYSPAIVQFIGKIFFPVNLSVLPILQDTTLVYGTIALFALVCLIIYGLRKRGDYWRYGFFGLLWFLGFLLPSFVKPNAPLAPDFIEHRTYAPLLGLMIILFKNDLLAKLNFNKKSIIAVLSAVVILFGIKNLIYQQNFKNRLVFWQNAVQNSPHSPLAHRNLGVMLYFENRFPEAVEQYQAALKLNPEEPMAHNNIGVILMNQGKLDEAANEYLAELKFNPNYDGALFNLGLVYYRQNKTEEAAKLWGEVIKINPDYPDIQKYLNLLRQTN